MSEYPKASVLKNGDNIWVYSSWVSFHALAFPCPKGLSAFQAESTQFFRHSSATARTGYINSPLFPLSIPDSHYICHFITEVQQFEDNVTPSVALDVLGDQLALSETILLFAAYNVDHNIVTIDGKGTGWLQL